MEEAFWQARWSEGRIGFHQRAVNPHLQWYFEQFLPGDTARGGHVFVPLCGKSLDLDWLLAQGMQVTGIEFHEAAVAEVFARLGQTPDITDLGALKRYRAGKLTLYVGDFYALETAELGRVDLVYDRAAMVAVDPKTRQAYGNQIAPLAARAQQLIISYDYDQAQKDGPPFSLPAGAIRTVYDGRYLVELLVEGAAGGSLGQQVAAKEQVWLLQPK